MGRSWDALVPFLRWMFSPYAESRRRRQFLVGVAGSFLAGGGLLAYGLLLPEVPFAGAPTTRIGDAEPGDAVKVWGLIDCSCLVAIDWSEEQVGLGLSDTHAAVVPFSVQDPSGTLFVDTDSLAVLKRGPHGGDYWRGDFAAVYGHVYDQGHGVLAIRAEVVAAHVDDSMARFAPAFVGAAAAGGLLVAAALADRWVFGHVPE
ncbi:MAG TPA: hypothetical protein VGB42_08850 [Candidatus Thermoplasmatota archaeon]